MSKILLKGRPYGGSTTVTDALHLLTKDTLNTDVSAQNMLTNILGDMAQLETSTAATKAYAKGEYLVLGSYFYKVIATIDPGDTLTVGTNIERTNVGAEMKSEVVQLTTHTTLTRIGGTRILRLNGYKVGSDESITIPIADRPGADVANIALKHYWNAKWYAIGIITVLTSGSVQLGKAETYNAEVGASLVDNDDIVYGVVEWQVG